MPNNKYKVLLVEDENNIRNLVTTILKSAGYQVVVAETCERALGMYTSHLPDIIILDLGLPDRDGMYFLKKVRDDSLTPIIILSARSNERDKVVALDAGANDYVTKPFSSAELLARVRATLRNTRHSSEEGKLPGGKFTLEGLVIDYDGRQVFVDEKEVKDGFTLPELIEMENVETPEYVTVSINEEFVESAAKDSTVLKDGDNVEFLYFMGGGSYGID